MKIDNKVITENYMEWGYESPHLSGLGGAPTIIYADDEEDAKFFAAVHNTKAVCREVYATAWAEVSYL